MPVPFQPTTSPTPPSQPVNDRSGEGGTAASARLHSLASLLFAAGLPAPSASDPLLSLAGLPRPPRPAPLSALPEVTWQPERTWEMRGTPSSADEQPEARSPPPPPLAGPSDSEGEDTDCEDMPPLLDDPCPWAMDYDEHMEDIVPPRNVTGPPRASFSSRGPPPLFVGRSGAASARLAAGGSGGEGAGGGADAISRQVTALARAIAGSGYAPSTSARLPSYRGLDPFYRGVAAAEGQQAQRGAQQAQQARAQQPLEAELSQLAGRLAELRRVHAARLGGSNPAAEGALQDIANQLHALAGALSAGATPMA